MSIDSIPTLRPGADLSPLAEAADRASLALYKEVSPSVVRIETGRSMGSGFAVGKEGEILTNFHVVAGSNEVFVRTADGERRRAAITKADDVKDLAVLQIEGKTPSFLKPLSLGDDATLKPAQEINAFGHPEGSDQIYFSPGTLKERTTNLLRFNQDQILAFSQFPAAPEDKTKFLSNPLLHGDIQLRHGNSGGPLVDGDGKVVGVSVYIDENSKRDGFFVPVSDAKSLLSGDTNKFKFDYEYKLPDGAASRFLHSYNERPLLTGALTAGAGYAGLLGLSKSGYLAQGLAGGLALFGAYNLKSDFSQLRAATNNRDLLKAGLNTFGDSAILLGGLSRSLLGTGSRALSSTVLSGAGSRLVGNVAGLGLQAGETYLSTAGKVGVALLAVGLAAKLAGQFIPDRLVNTKINRLDGKERVPFYLG